jgi:hypothetical protein
MTTCMTTYNGDDRLERGRVNRRRMLVLAAFVLCACEQSKPPSTVNPVPHQETVKSVPQDATASADGCPPDELEARWTEFKAASVPYLGTIQAQLPRWSECETARRDLTALAPQSSEYERVMRVLIEWQTLRGGACDEPFRAKAEGDATYSNIHRGFRPMTKAVTELKTRCADHPGFQQAYRDGILFMARKPDQ